MASTQQKPAEAQLHRLEGQLHGIARMITNGDPLEQTLQQIEAVRGNLKSLEKRLLKQQMGDMSDKNLQRCFDYLCKLN